MQIFIWFISTMLWRSYISLDNLKGVLPLGNTYYIENCIVSALKPIFLVEMLENLYVRFISAMSWVNWKINTYFKNFFQELYLFVILYWTLHCKNFHGYWVHFSSNFCEVYIRGFYAQSLRRVLFTGVISLWSRNIWKLA